MQSGTSTSGKKYAVHQEAIALSNLWAAAADASASASAAPASVASSSASPAPASVASSSAAPAPTFAASSSPAAASASSAPYYAASSSSALTCVAASSSPPSSPALSFASSSSSPSPRSQSEQYQTSYNLWEKHYLNVAKVALDKARIDPRYIELLKIVLGPKVWVPRQNKLLRNALDRAVYWKHLDQGRALLNTANFLKLFEEYVQGVKILALYEKTKLVRLSQLKESQVKCLNALQVELLNQRQLTLYKLNSLLPISTYKNLINDLHRRIAFHGNDIPVSNEILSLQRQQAENIRNMQITQKKISRFNLLWTNLLISENVVVDEQKDASSLPASSSNIQSEFKISEQVFQLLSSIKELKSEIRRTGAAIASFHLLKNNLEDFKKRLKESIVDGSFDEIKYRDLYWEPINISVLSCREELKSIKESVEVDSKISMHDAEYIVGTYFDIQQRNEIKQIEVDTKCEISEDSKQVADSSYNHNLALDPDKNDYKKILSNVWLKHIINIRLLNFKSQWKKFTDENFIKKFLSSGDLSILLNQIEGKIKTYETEGSNEKIKYDKIHFKNVASQNAVVGKYKTDSLNWFKNNYKKVTLYLPFVVGKEFNQKEAEKWLEDLIETGIEDIPVAGFTENNKENPLWNEAVLWHEDMVSKSNSEGIKQSLNVISLLIGRGACQTVEQFAFFETYLKKETSPRNWGLLVDAFSNIAAPTTITDKFRQEMIGYCKSSSNWLEALFSNNKIKGERWASALKWFHALVVAGGNINDQPLLNEFDRMLNVHVASWQTGVLGRSKMKTIAIKLTAHHELVTIEDAYERYKEAYEIKLEEVKKAEERNQDLVEQLRAVSIKAANERQRLEQEINEAREKAERLEELVSSERKEREEEAARASSQFHQVCSVAQSLSQEIIELKAALLKSQQSQASSSSSASVMSLSNAHTLFAASGRRNSNPDVAVHASRPSTP